MSPLYQEERNILVTGDEGVEAKRILCTQIALNNSHLPLASSCDLVTFS